MRTKNISTCGWQVGSCCVCWVEIARSQNNVDFQTLMCLALGAWGCCCYNPSVVAKGRGQRAKLAGVAVETLWKCCCCCFCFFSFFWELRSATLPKAPSSKKMSNLQKPKMYFETWLIDWRKKNRFGPLFIFLKKCYKTRCSITGRFWNKKRDLETSTKKAERVRTLEFWLKRF